MTRTHRSAKEIIAAIGNGDEFQFTSESARGTRLGVGIPPGRKRPVLYIESPAQRPRTVLALFNSPEHAAVAVQMLTLITDDIDKVIAFLSQQNGDSHGT